MMDRKEYIEQELPIKEELNLLFGSKKNQVIFEIGACEGEDSIKYARLFPTSTIYSFEPLPSNAELIRSNLAKYRISNVKLVEKALSSKKGNAEFHVSQGHPDNVGETDWDYGNKSSSLLAPEKHIELTKFIDFDNKIIVETDTIKSFCYENKIAVIDFIHMDVQGAEIMVLNGAEERIKYIKAIWLEVAEVELYKGQPLADDIYNFMKKNNFVLIKNCIEGFAGDQLYISKVHFRNYKKLFPNGEWRKSMLFYRVIIKFRRIISKFL